MGRELLIGLPTIVGMRLQDLSERGGSISRRRFGILAGGAAVGALLAGYQGVKSFDTPDPAVEQEAQDLRLFRGALRSILKTTNDTTFWTAIDAFTLGGDNLLRRNLAVSRGDTGVPPLVAVTGKFGPILPPINYYLQSPYDDPNFEVSEETISPEQRRNDLTLRICQGLTGEIISTDGTFSINQEGRFGCDPTRYGDNFPQLIDLADRFFINPPQQWVADVSSPLGIVVNGRQDDPEKTLSMAMQPRGGVSFAVVYKVI